MDLEFLTLLRRTYAEGGDLVPLLVERQDGFLVDVIGGGDDEVLEPLHVVLGRHLLPE